VTSIHRITESELAPTFFEAYVYSDLEHDYYWDDGWEPALYVELARAGFIAVAQHAPGIGPVLLPQLQRSYAVLDWADLHVSRKVRRLIASSRLAEGEPALRLAEDPAEVVAAVRATHDRAWLIDAYVELLGRLPQDGDPHFALHAVELRFDGRLVAGELGYTIGATYTSLTGFCSPEEPTLRHFGTLQLVWLAGLLRESGYAFWNLGHPHQDYKRSLGARVLARRHFLARWLSAREARPRSVLRAGREERSLPVVTPNDSSE